MLCSINKFSSSFPCLKGVRHVQGCNLSPLFFSLFINDLESYLLTNTAGSITLANCKVQLLLFADDLALLADSIKGLQDLIDRLADFCKTWKLNINMDKTKVVVFNRKHQVQHVPLTLDNMMLEYVTSYISTLALSSPVMVPSSLPFQHLPTRLARHSHSSEQLQS